MLYTFIYWLRIFIFIWRRFSRSMPEPCFHCSSFFITSKLSASTGSHLHLEACTTSQKTLKNRRCFQLVLSSAIQKAQIPHVLVLAKYHHKYLGYQCTIVTTVNNLNTHTQNINYEYSTAWSTTHCISRKTSKHHCWQTARSL